MRSQATSFNRDNSRELGGKATAGIGCTLLIGVLSLAPPALALRTAHAEVWEVTPTAETDATPSPDDTCIWVHPILRENSVVIGTSKNTPTGGLYAWSLDAGAPIWNNISADNGITNNVDLRYNFSAGSETWDILCTSNRSTRTIDVYRVVTDGAEDFQDLVKEGAIPIGNGWAGGTDAPYGCAMFQSADQYYCFISDKTGNVGQYHLSFDDNATEGNRIIGSRETFWDLTSDSSEVEGIVADDFRSVIYISAEDHALYRFETIDDIVDLSSSTTIAIHDATNGPFVRDIEGLTIWQSSAEGEGYLIASSQGHDYESSEFYSSYAVFDRTFASVEPNTYILNFTASESINPPIDIVTESDGLETVNLVLNETYKSGIFIVHDDINESGTENYKFFSWYDIATSPDSTSDHLRYIGDGTEFGWDPRTQMPEPDLSAVPGPESDSSQPPWVSRRHGLSMQVHPHPLVDQTTIKLEINQTELLTDTQPPANKLIVRLSIHDVSGREVALLSRASTVHKSQTFSWDGTDNDGRRLAAGTYWIRASSLEGVQTSKAIVVR